MRSHFGFWKNILLAELVEQAELKIGISSDALL